MRLPAPATAPRACALALLGLAALLVAAAAPPAAGQPKAGQDQGAWTLEPMETYHPPPTALAAGDALAFDWRVTEPAGALVHFSQHIHIGAQQLNLTETNASALQDRLVANREGLYSILWENRGREAVTFAFAYHTERGAASAPPAATPVPAALAGLALLAAAALARHRGP